MSISVYYIIGSLDVGGAERHTVQIAQGLSQKNLNIKVVTFFRKGKLAKLLEEQSIEVISLLSDNIWEKSQKLTKLILLAKCFFKLVNYLSREKPDIVHFILPMSYLLGAPASLLAGIKNRVLSRRSLNIYQKAYPGIHQVEKLLHTKMTRIIGNSKAVISELRAEGAKDSQIKLIYNGVSEKISKDKISSNQTLFLNQHINAFTIMVVANFIPYKGHLDLFRALNLIKDQLPENWILVLVGSDSISILDSLIEVAEEYNIYKRITVIKNSQDGATLLHCADIAVLPSHQEGFSNSILEAMVAGIPSVVTNAGGNAEAIRHGIDGLVVPIKNPIQLSRAILSLALDNNLRKKMSFNCKKRAQEHFSIDKCISEYFNLYQDIIEKKHSSI